MPDPIIPVVARRGIVNCARSADNRDYSFAYFLDEIILILAPDDLDQGLFED